MRTERLRIDKLVQNNGQIEGLPKNPRKWSKEEVERLKRSIDETPELLEARGVIVYPLNYDKYIVLGGNMRLTACKQLGHKVVPCYILPEDTDVDKLKEIVIKDNGSFGDWDRELLGVDWGDLPLKDWGVDFEIKATELKDLSEDIDNEFVIEITCEDEIEQEQIYNELIEKGYKCRLLTL